MSLNKEQQQKALSDGSFPKVSFRGDTAHHFAAVPSKIGVDLELGVVSEHGVPMAYAHSNGIRYATQFHSEHYYNTSNPQILSQHVWFENFIDLARMHHQNVNNPQALIEHYKFIKDTLMSFVNEHSEQNNKALENGAINPNLYTFEIY